MEVLVNHVAGMISMGRTPERKRVQAVVVRLNEKAAWVRLPDGHIIKRKLRRDFDGSAPLDFGYDWPKNPSTSHYEIVRWDLPEAT